MAGVSGAVTTEPLSSHVAGYFGADYLVRPALGPLRKLEGLSRRLGGPREVPRAA